MTNWQPRLGATVFNDGTVFRVWAPDASLVSIVRDGVGDAPMDKSSEGYFGVTLDDCHAGDLYRFKVDNQGPFPDPASRFQPHGVHGPSQVIDPSTFEWTDLVWKGIPRESLILYEIHVGTFTPKGSFQSAIERLPELQDLGITAIELMPVADFPGHRNWGYDGVSLFAPARCYGVPDDLRRLVDVAHQLGLAVFLDVVYNHFGPDGAYHSQFSRHYFSQAHCSPWGKGINFDGPHCGPVRKFFIENALRWIHEYHLDGLRLDATHAIVDSGNPHILASLVSAVKKSVSDSVRRVHLIAEDVGNLAHMVKPEIEGGWGLDAVWSDDYHHQMRCALAGDRDGYFQDFDGSARSIEETAKKGWFYCGQYAPFFQRKRGSDPCGLDYSRFVFFLQNHDQIGNRAFGDRLHHRIDPAVFRAASVFLLMLPQIPLIFMGQEWAASTPFLYFTDHHPELGRLVTEGRRREFARFAAFSDPRMREAIPDPQAESTLEASRLIWKEREKDAHASVLRLYRSLIALRKSLPALRSTGHSGDLSITAFNEEVLIVRREDAEKQTVVAVVRLAGKGPVDWSAGRPDEGAPGSKWELILDTEDRLFAPDGEPPRISLASSTVQFARPGAIVLQSARGA
jgi:maltooligosyltrehalose trehalohydrolase